MKDNCETPMDSKENEITHNGSTMMEVDDGRDSSDFVLQADLKPLKNLEVYELFVRTPQDVEQFFLSIGTFDSNYLLESLPKIVLRQKNNEEFNKLLGETQFPKLLIDSYR